MSIYLIGEETEVVSELVMGGDDDTVTRLVELRSTSSTEDLEDVKDAHVNKRSVLGVVDLSSLDDDSMRREVDPPGQGSCAHQHSDLTTGKIFLHQVPETTNQRPVLLTIANQISLFTIDQ